MQNCTTLISPSVKKKLHNIHITKWLGCKKILLHYHLMILIAILPLTIFAQKNSTLPEAGSVADSLFLTIPPSKQLQKLPLPAASLQAAPEAIIIEGPFCDDKMDIPPHNFTS